MEKFLFIVLYFCSSLGFAGQSLITADPVYAGGIIGMGIGLGRKIHETITTFDALKVHGEEFIDLEEVLDHNFIHECKLVIKDAGFDADTIKIKVCPVFYSEKLTFIADSNTIVINNYLLSCIDNFCIDTDEARAVMKFFLAAELQSLKTFTLRKWNTILNSGTPTLGGGLVVLALWYKQWIGAGAALAGSAFISGLSLAYNSYATTKAYDYVIEKLTKEDCAALLNFFSPLYQLNQGANEQLESYSLTMLEKLDKRYSLAAF